MLEGRFVLDRQTRVEFAPGAPVESLAASFVSLLARTGGPQLAAPSPMRQSECGACIRFELSAGGGEAGEEGYSLHISPQRIVVRATHPRGLFYGGVSLWQVITTVQRSADAWLLPALAIEDAPRFRWRGLMLDVARHYMPPQFIKRLLDEMALHKLNTFLLAASPTTRAGGCRFAGTRI
ncbi:MAG: family 20 glycosylhydrolase [Gammaproteobacteria bacterium]|nr:family 20 glycosylhydrolase [Gammaproteobacteria bacterium]